MINQAEADDKIIGNDLIDILERLEGLNESELEKLGIICFQEARERVKKDKTIIYGNKSD